MKRFLEGVMIGGLFAIAAGILKTVKSLPYTALNDDERLAFGLVIVVMIWGCLALRRKPNG
jgi:hypothetical protein